MLPVNNYIAMKFGGKRLEDGNGQQMVLQKWMGSFPSIEAAEEQCMQHFDTYMDGDKDNPSHVSPERIVSIVYKQCGDADADSKVLRWDNVPLGDEIIVSTTLYQVYHIHLDMFQEYADCLRADYPTNGWHEASASTTTANPDPERIPPDYLFYVCHYFDIDKAGCEADPDYPWKNGTTPPWNELLDLVRFAITRGHVHSNDLQDVTKQHHYLFQMSHFAVVQL